ncbi:MULTISPECIES: hypothetical protein [Acidithrix]|uniref:Uncharacterized protein n=1 Tax=Acidithrix ferrooxidans TaxID=1280514 RepID=A0A0D8HJW0_9ACTN|nr:MULTISPECIES: hypothetical protein [Acidithrix]KJF18189.1 hypothetical protein AXFE_09350 [Acidithrix ferrooxidans]
MSTNRAKSDDIFKRLRGYFGGPKPYNDAPKHGLTSLKAHIFLPALVSFACAPLLSSCGSSAGTNGTKACQLVNQALLELKAPITPQKNQNALGLLRRALPYAAIAAGSNGDWQPLEATLSETNRVKITNLQSALTAECANGNAGNINGSGVFEQASIPQNSNSAG